MHDLAQAVEPNLMTAGHGICHSEVTTTDTTTVHGVQLWVALPQAARHTDRDFQHYAPPAIRCDGAQLRVFLGTLAGQTAPIHTFSPLVGAEITLDAGCRLVIDIDPSFEHGLLVDSDTITVDDNGVARGAMAYLGADRTAVTLSNSAAIPAGGLLLSGRPLNEEIVMWWNFVARSHDEIVAYRQAWQDEAEQFGYVQGYRGARSRLPAPPLPTTRLLPRSNRD